jgi:hypothetical protein
MWKCITMIQLLFDLIINIDFMLQQHYSKTLLRWRGITGDQVALMFLPGQIRYNAYICRMTHIVTISYSTFHSTAAKFVAQHGYFLVFRKRLVLLV